MNKRLEQTLRLIEQLSEGDQDAAAGAMLDYLAHRNAMQLTDAQVAEGASPVGPGAQTGLA